MKKKHILIVKHVEQEGPGSIADFFRNTAFGLKTIELGRGEQLPSLLDDIAAVVVMGGPMNVYEEKKYPFLKTENTFIQTVVEKNIPYLGVCLGAQLLTKACGAKVTAASEKEIGWYKVTLMSNAKSDILFSGLSSELEVFQWHGDMCTLPAGGILLGSSPVCIQAFRYGKNAYGLQFHIEVTPEMVHAWLKDEKVENRAEILAESERKCLQLKKSADSIYKNFLKIIG